MIHPYISYEHDYPVMLLCVYSSPEVTRAARKQQQSFISDFSRTFVTVPSPTEPGFVNHCRV